MAQGAVSITKVAEYATGELSFDGSRFAVSHGGEKIAFVRKDDVCVVSTSNQSADDRCASFPYAISNRQPIIRWSPDDSRLAVIVSGDLGALWIVELQPEGKLVPVEVNIEGGDLLWWVDSNRLITGSWGRSPSPRLAEVKTGAPIRQIGCNLHSEADGYVLGVTGQPQMIGSNRWGEILAVTANPGTELRITCEVVPAHPGNRVWNPTWLRYESVLDQDRLLFSVQPFDQGTQYRLGRELVALDRLTFKETGRFTCGSPAAVSQDGQRIAAFAIEKDALVFRICRTDGKIEGSVPMEWPGLVINGERQPLSDQEWEGASPAWSPGGRYVLARIAHPRGLGMRGFLVQAAGTGIFPLLSGVSGVVSIEWAGNDQLLVQTQDGLISIYRLSGS